MNQLKLYPELESMPSLFTATYMPTGEHWNFHLMEWTSPLCAQCFTSNPDVVQASWGIDDKDTEVKEYKLTLKRVYKDRKGK
jgi:hypothetical protein